MHDPGDTNGSLIEYLYGNASQISMAVSVNKGSGLDLYNYPLVIRFLSLVHSVDPVNLRVELVRPLPFDINTQWLNLTLHMWQPTVQNVCMLGVGGLGRHFAACVQGHRGTGMAVGCCSVGCSTLVEQGMR